MGSFLWSLGLVSLFLATAFVVAVSLGGLPAWAALVIGVGAGVLVAGGVAAFAMRRGWLNGSRFASWLEGFASLLAS
ncbi:MAG: hypothetical protein AAGI52_14980 [Bacteroidota bacterium]